MAGTSRRRRASILPSLAGVVAVVASFVAAQRALACTAPLFGGSVPWRFGEWRRVTDSVRGGASKAELRGAKEKDASAEFSGSLEPLENSGNSFAGMSVQADVLPEDITNLRGLTLDVARGDGKEYSVFVKLRASIADAAHKFRFRAEEGATYEMSFKDFVPYLRGKPASQPAPPLNLERVESIGIQIEGAEEQQLGPFNLALRGLSGMVGQEEPEKGPPPRETRWTCEACQTMNYEEFKTCVRCGAARGVELVEVVEERQAKAKKQKWECPGCGAMNFAAVEECHKCGGPRG